MKKLTQIQNKLKNIKGFLTAAKHAEKFVSNQEDVHVEYSAEEHYSANDTISIFADGRLLFKKTYTQKLGWY